MAVLDKHRGTSVLGREGVGGRGIARDVTGATTNHLKRKDINVLGGEQDTKLGNLLMLSEKLEGDVVPKASVGRVLESSLAWCEVHRDKKVVDGSLHRATSTA